MKPDVVLIDSGINPAHPHLAGQGELVAGPAFDSAGGRSEGGSAPLSLRDDLGHGTAAAAAILDLAPGITLVSSRVFHERHACPFEVVLAALQHALELAPRLVNLSLGSAHPRWVESLEPLVARAVEAEITIVAPASFRGLPAWPGSLPGVEGVVPDPARPRDRPDRRASGDQVYWYASPWPRALPGLERERNLSGASLAVANVTGWLARGEPPPPTPGDTAPRSPGE